MKFLSPIPITSIDFRKNPQLFEVITPNKDPKHFNPDAPTYVVVHGWTVRDYALYRIKDNYLRTGDVNVIMVDWTRYSVDLYPKSAASTKYVGERVSINIIRLLLKIPEVYKFIHITTFTHTKRQVNFNLPHHLTTTQHPAKFSASGKRGNGSLN